jgi:hypothetical protein
MEPEKDATIERLMQGQARYLDSQGMHPRHACEILTSKTRDLHKQLERMMFGRTMLAAELRSAIDDVHDALFELEEEINRHVEVLV